MGELANISIADAIYNKIITFSDDDNGVITKSFQSYMQAKTITHYGRIWGTNFAFAYNKQENKYYVFELENITTALRLAPEKFLNETSDGILNNDDVIDDLTNILGGEAVAFNSRLAFHKDYLISAGTAHLPTILLAKIKQVKAFDGIGSIDLSDHYGLTDTQCSFDTACWDSLHFSFLEAGVEYRSIHRIFTRFDLTTYSKLIPNYFAFSSVGYEGENKQENFMFFANDGSIYNFYRRYHYSLPFKCDKYSLNSFEVPKIYDV